MGLLSIRRFGSYISRSYDRLTRVGIDHDTPVFLIDRIVYSNFVFLVGTLVNAFAAIDNIAKGYRFLIFGNVVYQVAAFVGFLLNKKRRYLAARVMFLLICLLTMMVESAVQGPYLQIEHLILGAAVLSFSMFHPSERIYGAIFVAGSLISYLILINRSHALLPFDPDANRYTSTDLLVNQLSYTALILFSLIGMSNAYARATRIVDEQRSQLFEQSRMSALGAVACSVAHEINTPLMAMNIYLDELDASLSEQSGTRADSQAVDKLGQLSRRIATIVRGFKRMSHSDSDDSLTEVTLEDLLRPALDICAGLLKPLGVAMTVTLHDPQYRVRCHVVALSQVVLNLLTNSVDAVAELATSERWIRVETETDEQRLYITVTDAGSIASEQVRGRLFEAFFTTKPLGKGSGLGLNISRRAVEFHGGRLYLDSASRNTKFVIDLPLAEVGAEAERLNDGNRAA